MKKYGLLVAGLVLIVGAVFLSGCGPGNTTLSGDLSNIRVNLNGQQEGIWVSGTGEVSAVPDVANLRLGIEAQEKTVAEAQSKAAEAMDRVMKSLVDNGVAKKDIQTQNFNIRQVTKWDNEKQESVVIGYAVTNMVSAKIREISKAGAIIDAVVVAGGDLTRVDSISFSVDDPAAYYGEARQKAMADAKAKAAQLAELAGIKLGKPTYVSESVYMPSPIFRQDLVGKAAAAPLAETPISPGETKITLNVQVTYDILAD